MNMQLGVWWSREKLWVYSAWRLQGSKPSGKEEHKAVIFCLLDLQLMKHVRENCGDPEQCQWSRKATRHLWQIKSGQKDKLVGWPPQRVNSWERQRWWQGHETALLEMACHWNYSWHSLPKATLIPWGRRQVYTGGTLYRNGPQSSPSSNIHSRAVSSHNGPCQESPVKRSREGGTESLLPVAMWVNIEEDPPD